MGGAVIVFGWPYGKWHDVPNYALIDPKTNKLGYAVVWLWPRPSLQIYCFLPGSGG
jgi:hypothetical protein